jgi:hypothetical protein
LTQSATEIAGIVKEIDATRPDKAPYPTAGHVLSVYFGENTSKLRDCGDMELAGFERGSAFKGMKDLLSQVFAILVERDVFGVHTKIGQYGAISYFCPGPEIDSELQPVLVSEFVEAVPEGLTQADMPLFRELLDCRKILAADEQCSVPQILSTPFLTLIAEKKPKDLRALETLGIPRPKVDAYGRFFVDAVAKYARTSFASTALSGMSFPGIPYAAPVSMTALPHQPSFAPPQAPVAMPGTPPSQARPRQQRQRAGTATPRAPPAPVMAPPQLPVPVMQPNPAQAAFAQQAGMGFSWTPEVMLHFFRYLQNLQNTTR